MRTMIANDPSSPLARGAGGVEIVRHGIDPFPVMRDFTGAGSLSRDQRISILRTLQVLHA